MDFYFDNETLAAPENVNYFMRTPTKNSPVKFRTPQKKFRTPPKSSPCSSVGSASSTRSLKSTMQRILMDSELPNITTRPLVTQITDRPGKSTNKWSQPQFQVVHSNSAHLGYQHCVGSPVPQVFKFAVHMLLLKKLNPGLNWIRRAARSPPRTSYNHLENSKQSIFCAEKEQMYGFCVVSQLDPNSGKTKSVWYADSK